MSNPILYDPNVPNRKSDPLATTQPQLLNNFLSLYNVFAENHVPLDTASIAGNHNVIQLLEQPNDIQTDVSEISVYVKDDKTSTDQIFIRYQGNGQTFQWTAYQIYGLTQTAQLQPFFTILPGRVIVYFGNFTTGGIPNNILNLFPPIATHIISVIATQSDFNFSPGGKPTVDVITPSGDQKYITQLEFFNSTGDNFAIIGQNYLVMANF